MKKLILSAVFMLLFAAFLPTFACTNFIVTKGASKDGSVMVSYSADSHTLYGELYHWSAATYPAGTMMDVIEWDSGKKMGQIPQVTQTYNVVGNMNEFQVCIAETTFGGLDTLKNPNGIMDYGSLIYITLQRVKSAREAIKCISELLDAHGYCSSGESFSIIDKHEAWIFEMIGKGEQMLDAKGKPVKGWTKGAVWVARLIPDGYVSGHANQARVQTFPLADGKISITNRQFDKLYNPEVTTIYSWDIISFARLKGLYPKDVSDAQFSFSDIYAPMDFGAARYCEARVWAGFLRLNKEEMLPYESYARGEDLTNRMPLWILPKEKVDLRNVMQLMRDHYEGTSMDMTKDLGAGPYEWPYRWRPMSWSVDDEKYIHERATATQQTGFSFIGQARSQYPDGFGGILWFGVDDAASCCYVPMFCCITSIPEPFKEGNGSMIEYSTTAAFWTFTKVSNYVYTRYNAMIKHVIEKQYLWENKSIDEINKMTPYIVNLFNTDPRKAVDQLNNFSYQRSHDVVNEWNKLFEYLLVKYHDGNIKKEENGKFITNGNEKPQVVFPEQPKYPDYWYRMIVNDCGPNIKAK
ncbi:MAG: C69 family dipeptidase [Bacteroidales bacterium]|jgi:dipeptidase|nr:C69 family dipeptidase [Bacteroidales bacterium]